MDIHSWKETWGTINWTFDSEKQIKAKIKKFYHAGVDFNMVDENDNSGCTPLFWAVNNSTPGVIAFIIDGGANPEVRDNNNCTVLHAAVTSICPKKEENIKYLLEHGPKKLEEAKDFRGNTPLYVAALAGKTDVVRILLDHNPDIINEKNNYGGTALGAAVEWNYVSTVKVLIERGAEINAKGYGDSVSPKVKELIKNAKQIRDEYLASASSKPVETKAKQTKKKASWLSRLFNRQYE